MEKLFIAQDLPFGQNKTYNQVAVGQLGITGMMNDIVSPVEIDTKYSLFTVFMGGDYMQNCVVNEPKKVELIKIPYAEAVKRVVRVSMEYLGKAKLDTFIIDIAPENGEFVMYQKETFSVNGKYASQAALYTALAKEINTNSIFFTATVGAAGIDITNKNGTIMFYVGSRIEQDMSSICVNDCDCVDPVTKVIVEGNVGSGNCQQIKDLSRILRPESGAMGDYRDKDTPSPYILLEGLPCSDAYKFDLYKIRWANKQQANGEPSKVFENVNTLWVSFPKDAVNQDGFEQIIESLFGAKFVNRAI